MRSVLSVAAVLCAVLLIQPSAQANVWGLFGFDCDGGHNCSCGPICGRGCGCGCERSCNVGCGCCEKACGCEQNCGCEQSCGCEPACGCGCGDCCRVNGRQYAGKTFNCGCQE